MLNTLGILALGLAPVYLIYRAWQHYLYTKSLEQGLRDRGNSTIPTSQ
jgi:hypothetical protein